jgi:hypothetical protein
MSLTFAKHDAKVVNKTLISVDTHIFLGKNMILQANFFQTFQISKISSQESQN